MKDDLKTTKKLCEGDKITLKDYSPIKHQLST